MSTAGVKANWQHHSGVWLGAVDDTTGTRVTLAVAYDPDACDWLGRAYSDRAPGTAIGEVREATGRAARDAIATIGKAHAPEEVPA